MKRRLFKTARRASTALLLLLSTFMVGQVGVVPGLLAVSNAEADTCCDHESGADERGLESAEDGPARVVASHKQCPNDGSDAPCGPGCDHCSCCPGAVFAVIPTVTAHLLRVPLTTTLEMLNQGSAAGVPGQIFIPPERAAA
jgi:hypothetical protein